METYIVRNLAIETANMEANLLRQSLESESIEHKVCDKMKGGGVGGGPTTKRQRTSFDFPCGMIIFVVTT